MKIKNDPPKAVLNCRAEVLLKEQIEAEATEKGLTVSNYMEQILLRRHDSTENVDLLKKRIFQLEAEVFELSKHQKTLGEEQPENLLPEMQNRQLKQQILEMRQELKLVSQQRNALVKHHSEAVPHWLSQNGYEELVKMLKNLQQIFPKKDYERLLLASVAVAIKNSKSNFFVLTLQDFWRGHPHFLTQKNISA